MKANLFAIAVIAASMPIPLANLALEGGIPAHPMSLENIRGAAAYSLAQLGISVNPNQVYVGKENFLFLGPRYANTVWNSSQPASAVDQEFAKARLLDWEVFSHAIDAELGKPVFLLIGPNKSSVYTNLLPHAMQPSSISKIQSVRTELSRAPNVVDPSDRLRASSSKTYYASDTHWNRLGGYLGYRVLIEKMQGQLGGHIKSIDLDESQFLRTTRSGGDLSKFLMSQGLTAEFELAPRDPIPTDLSQVEDSGEISQTWDSAPVIGEVAGDQAKRFLNPQALNDLSVLWIRDSFGSSPSAYVLATFSEVVSVHTSDVENFEELSSLVDKYSPDFVLFTIVERKLISPNLLIYQTPPAGEND